MFQRPIQELFELRKITIDNPEVLQEGLFKKKPKNLYIITLMVNLFLKKIRMI